MKFGKLLSLYVIIIFAISGVVATPKVNAQVSTGISVDIVPPNPTPYQNTNITLNSFADNLDIVVISWSVNGKTATSGIGQKSFYTTAPAAGGQINVTATVNLPSGIVVLKIPIQASVMTLLPEAMDSYVPPFYKGKALPTQGSEIKVVAMPEIRTASGLLDSNKLTYSWQQDYTNNVAGWGFRIKFFFFFNLFFLYF